MNVKPPDHWLPGWHLGCPPIPPYQPGPACGFFLLKGGSFSCQCQLPGKKNSKCNRCYINTTELNKTWIDLIKADILWAVWGWDGQKQEQARTTRKLWKEKPNEGKIEWSHRQIVVGTATQSDWRRQNITENANTLLMKQMKVNNDKAGTLKWKSSRREQGCCPHSH